MRIYVAVEKDCPLHDEEFLVHAMGDAAEDSVSADWRRPRKGRHRRCGGAKVEQPQGRPIKSMKPRRPARLTAAVDPLLHLQSEME
jgi:hypothetical protein